MKKNYLKPEMDVMEITIESMIATSPGESIGGDDNESNNPDDFSANDRRGNWGDLWN